MLSQLSMITPPEFSNSSPSHHISSENDALEQAAKDFEASYISQMLRFSGLDKALTMGGGDDMSAFASFYIESLAEKISDNGGFGLAEKFYQNMLGGHETGLGEIVEDSHVELGKL